MVPIRFFPAIMLAGVAGSAAPAPAHIAAATEASCRGLARQDFAAVEDAPGRGVAATIIAGQGDLPAYCEATGTTWRNVRFRVRLPLAGWNGKLVVFGTGGQAGDFPPDDPASPVSPSGSALRQGFATATHDGGHVGRETDARWSWDDEPALLDFGFRAPHAAGLIARAIVDRAYGRPARRTYYSGCSNGGREALQMAQRYPQEYDGIVAGAPSMRWSRLFANLYWFGNRLYGPQAVIGDSALRLLHRHVLDRCDRLDGKADGILDDPRACRVDLAPITCKAGEQSGCLSAAQAKAVREIYDGPRDGAGRSIALSSAMPGSELTWKSFKGIETYPVSVLRYQSFMPAAGPDFVPEEARLADYLRRSAGSDAIVSADNPDLRRFRDRGGKLLSYMGWNDAIGDIGDTLDYHATVERLIGGRGATLGFYRLFMVPGMNHCSGGDGAGRVDWLAALDAWVDRGQPPDRITGTHPGADGRALFARTMTPFISDPHRSPSPRPVSPSIRNVFPNGTQPR